MRAVLPCAAALALVALLTGASCDDSSPTTPEGPIAFETLVQTSVPGQSGGQIREAIRDEASWRSMWAALRAGSSLPQEPPAVDFSREMVVVTAMETQSCVSRVTIRSIRLDRSAVVVDVLEAPPAPNCICITSERPIHVVKLRRLTDPVRFTVERGQTNC